MEDGGRWQGVTLARVAGIEETWSGKFRAYHIDIYISWLFLETCSILTPTPADWSQPSRQQLHDSGARIAGSANPPRDHRWVRKAACSSPLCQTGLLHGKQNQGSSHSMTQLFDLMIFGKFLPFTTCRSKLSVTMSPCFFWMFWMPTARVPSAAFRATTVAKKFSK